ncbi:sulfatase-like hydrolase/transferase [candidate division KSB1 bacterium]|nr:sulfatase-like hydrolase/transferase [candidate division KSB1 bacterium]
MTISRRHFLKRFSMFLSTLAVAPVTVAQKTNTLRNNVLFITIDDLNDWIGCLGGHPQARTPNIDRLASQGMLFRNAHCAVPVCGPSRGAIFTGLQPWKTGNFSNGDKNAFKSIGREFKTLPQDLRKAGYNTYGAGKLLHGNINQYPIDDMFTDYGPEYEKWLPFTDKEIVYTDKELNGSVDKSMIKRKVDRGPGKLNVTLPLNDMPRERNPGSRRIDSFDWGGLPVDDSEMGDYQTAEWAIDKLKQKQDNPFFLGVGIYRPHIPLYVPQKYVDMFPPDQIQLPNIRKDDLSDLPPVARDLALKEYTAGTHKIVVEHNQWRKAVSCYLACVAFVDAQVGRVLDALDASPYRENTTIVLWSDHGWHLGEKEHWGKYTGWERSTHSPLIIVPPKNSQTKYKAGQTCDHPVGLVDIYPTVLDLIHFPQNDQLDGKSLVPLLRDSESKLSDHVVTSFGRGNHTVRTNTWRYTRYYDGSEELYDVQHDPNEFHNLANQAKYNPVKQELKGKCPAYENVDYFVSMKYWKAVIYKDRSKTELFDFKDNKAIPEGDNVASKHPQVINTMLRYIRNNNIKTKYVSIPD